MREEPTTTLKLHRFLGPVPAGDSSETVTGLIARVVQDAAAQAEVVCPKGAGNFPKQAMLGVVTYCYAKGVCGSGDIERKLWGNPEVRRAAGNDIPDAKAIRRFRRMNRPTLQAALECVLKSIRRMVARETVGQSLETGEPVAKSASNQAPGEETTTLVRREASARLDTAAMLDSTLDD